MLFLKYIFVDLSSFGMRAQKYFLGQILKLAVMVLIVAEVQSFTTPFGYSQVSQPVRRQPRNNVCRISFIEDLLIAMEHVKVKWSCTLM